MLLLQIVDCIQKAVVVLDDIVTHLGEGELIEDFSGTLNLDFLKATKV
jgi:hypothetical protein